MSDQETTQEEVTTTEGAVMPSLAMKDIMALPEIERISLLASYLGQTIQIVHDDGNIVNLLVPNYMMGTGGHSDYRIVGLINGFFIGIKPIFEVDVDKHADQVDGFYPINESQLDLRIRIASPGYLYNAMTAFESEQIPHIFTMYQNFCKMSNERVSWYVTLPTNSWEDQPCNVRALFTQDLAQPLLDALYAHSEVKYLIPKDDLFFWIREIVAFTVEGGQFHDHDQTDLVVVNAFNNFVKQICA